MLSLTKILFAALLLCSLTALAVAQTDTATIITGQGGPSYVDVRLDKTKPAAAPSGGLFLIPDNGPPELITNTVSEMSPTFARFRFVFPDSSFNADNDYNVELLVPVSQAGVAKFIKVDIQAASALSLSLTKSSLDAATSCSGGITILASTALDDYDWQRLFKKLDELEPNPRRFATVRIHVQGDTEELPWPEFRLKSVTDGRGAQVTTQKHLRICLLTEKRLPSGLLNIEVTFNENRPPDFPSKVTKKNFPGSSEPTPPSDEEIKSPEDRLIQQNLDLGVSLTSAVTDEDVAATATAPATVKRMRTTRGVLDVRLAPWILGPVVEDNKLMHFLTPIFLNANVATGSITKETLSLNRILIGLQGQFRYRDVNEDNKKIVTHRITYGFIHASDRDFKQDEFTGQIEYAPIIWDWNIPISLNYTVEDNEDKSKPYGYTFLPKVGFELGRTYHRQNPAVGIEPSATVRRFYFGVDMSLDLTKHFTFTVSDTAYVRGESSHKLRNYFKGGLEAPLGRIFNSGVQSLFFSFEKGDLAPFATPAVNSIKLGYRVQY